MKLYEKAPPGEKAESWIKSNKARFKKRYGETAGERVLYAKAWKLFGEETVNETSDWYGEDDDQKYHGSAQKGRHHVYSDGKKASADFATHLMRGKLSSNHRNVDKFHEKFHHNNGVYTSKKTGDRFKVDSVQHKDLANHYVTHLGKSVNESKSDEEKDKNQEKAKKREKSKKMLAAFQRVANVKEDTAPTNVMGASAADPNSPPIQGFSPMLHKRALKRKVKDVKLDRILALLRRGLK